MVYTCNTFNAALMVATNSTVLDDLPSPVMLPPIATQPPVDTAPTPPTPRTGAEAHANPAPPPVLATPADSAVPPHTPTESLPAPVGADLCSVEVPLPAIGSIVEITNVVADREIAVSKIGTCRTIARATLSPTRTFVDGSGAPPDIDQVSNALSVYRKERN